MEVKIYQVDAFTSIPFGGNPAGVVLDAEGIPQEYMQKIAKEMNLSETAFVIPIDDYNYKVRYFTPVDEVDLCGHATIASFYTLAYKGYLPSINTGMITAYQETKVGKLPVDIYYKDGEIDKIVMEQSPPKDLGQVKDIQPLLDCFNIGIEDIGIGRKLVYPQIVSTGLPDIIMPINKKEKLDNLKVDFHRLATLSKKLNVIGVHAFHLPEFNSDRVYTRNFAPLVGINEEAATGTSNGALIYFLKKYGYIERKEMLSFQGQSLNRPSVIYCMIDEVEGKYNVKVGGRAKVVLEGVLYF